MIIRTDADSRIGIGHLMRCLTLAHGWQARGGKIVFATNCIERHLLLHLAAANVSVERIDDPHPNPKDWVRTSGILNSHPDAWVVLDGYHFDSTYQARIKRQNHKLLAIDDAAHLSEYHADIILNQNINAEQLQYPVERHTRLLLGLRYVLLRPEFVEKSVLISESPQDARRLLVTLGGADLNNQTMKVINAIDKINIDGLEAKIVVGPANPHLRELQSRAKGAKTPIQLEINSSQMANLMNWADLVITAGGGTCWELACMGRPALVIILAENQKAVANGLHEMGAVTNLGWYHDLSTGQIAQAVEHLLLNAAKRKKMAAISRQLVDGKGTARVLRNLIEQ